MSTPSKETDAATKKLPLVVQNNGGNNRTIPSVSVGKSQENLHCFQTGGNHATPQWFSPNLDSNTCLSKADENTVASSVTIATARPANKKLLPPKAPEASSVHVIRRRSRSAITPQPAFTPLHEAEIMKALIAIRPYSYSNFKASQEKAWNTIAFLLGRKFRYKSATQIKGRVTNMIRKLENKMVLHPYVSPELSSVEKLTAEYVRQKDDWEKTTIEAEKLIIAGRLRDFKNGESNSSLTENELLKRETAELKLQIVAERNNARRERRVAARKQLELQKKFRADKLKMENLNLEFQEQCHEDAMRIKNAELEFRKQVYQEQVRSEAHKQQLVAECVMAFSNAI